METAMYAHYVKALNSYRLYKFKAKAKTTPVARPKVTNAQK